MYPTYTQRHLHAVWVPIVLDWLNDRYLDEDVDLHARATAAWDHACSEWLDRAMERGLTDYFADLIPGVLTTGRTPDVHREVERCLTECMDEWCGRLERGETLCPGD